MAVFSAAFPLILLFLSVSSPSVNGKSSPAFDECYGAVILNMATCLTFIDIGSQVDKPEDSCCSDLKEILDMDGAECLCQGLKDSGSLGFKVNMTKAVTLPAVCKLNAHPTSACAFTTSPPASAPAPVPAARLLPGLGSKSSTNSPSVSAPAPGPSNHGSSLIPISGLSFAISGALVILFSRI